jgi:hypothetical protein
VGNLSDRVDFLGNFDVQAHLSNIFAEGAFFFHRRFIEPKFRYDLQDSIPVPVI